MRLLPAQLQNRRTARRMREGHWPVREVPRRMPGRVGCPSVEHGRACRKQSQSYGSRAGVVWRSELTARGCCSPQSHEHENCDGEARQNHDAAVSGERHGIGRHGRIGNSIRSIFRRLRGLGLALVLGGHPSDLPVGMRHVQLIERLRDAGRSFGNAFQLEIPVLVRRESRATQHDPIHAGFNNVELV